MLRMGLRPRGANGTGSHPVVRPVNRAVPRDPAPALFSLLVAVLYGASPIDLLPDLIPLLGWMDDGVVLGLLVALAAWHWFRGRGPRRGRVVPADAGRPQRVPSPVPVRVR